jgi:hypothetical protein
MMATVTPGIAPLRPPILRRREWELIDAMQSKADECLRVNNMPGYVAWCGAVQMVRTRLASVDIDPTIPGKLG